MSNNNQKELRKLYATLQDHDMVKTLFIYVFNGLLKEKRIKQKRSKTLSIQAALTDSITHLLKIQADKRLLSLRQDVLCLTAVEDK